MIIEILKNKDSYQIDYFFSQFYFSSKNQFFMNDIYFFQGINKMIKDFLMKMIFHEMI